MKKKIIAIIAVLLVAAAIFAVYKLYIVPRAAAGQKTVTIHVIIENQDIDKKYTYETKHEYLGELLEEKKDELGATLEDMGGTFVSGMADYKADSSKNEFFSVKVNGVDAMTGVDEIPLNDGETYSFVLTTW